MIIFIGLILLEIYLNYILSIKQEAFERNF
jgi:hypothetical protein